ncbi:terminase large subunit [Phreatobacter sp.]|uniref:terminase large subunit n=1 Tax=Phreatobacter sp. TaxID=1966341 RepID=UPI003F702C83
MTDAWSFACPDWVERLKAGRSLVPDLPLDVAEANRAVAIFDKLRLPDVPGTPALKEAAGEWARDIVRAAFGSLDPETRSRRVPEIFALVPKKNSKTTYCGGAVAIVALLANKRPRAEMLFIGPTQEIADLAFQQASGMIACDPEGYLQKRFHVIEHQKTILDRLTRAKMKIKTFDLKVITGSKPVVVILDELHVMSQLSYASRVLGQIRGGLIPNPESLLIMITTQSDDVPAGVFRTELDYARGVRDGRITEDVRMLPILYEFPEEMQASGAWRNPDVWPMVLPNLGRSITIERLLPEYRGARDKGLEEERRWASQHLNVEIGMGLHSARWRGADLWEEATDPSLAELGAFLDRCEVVTAGVDGGGMDDPLALALIGRCHTTRDWLHWGRAWVQRAVLDLRKDIAERLLDFERDGDLVLCEDATEDIMALVDIVERVHHAGLLPKENAVGLDPYMVGALVDEFATRGLTVPALVAVGQGTRLSPAIWGLERKLKDGTFRHGGRRAMAWNVANAKAEQRGNAVLITKQTAGKAKIDMLVAAFNAAMLMAKNPEADGPSVYETRGVLMV